MKALEKLYKLRKSGLKMPLWVENAICYSALEKEEFKKKIAGLQFVSDFYYRKYLQCVKNLEELEQENKDYKILLEEKLNKN